MHHSFLFFFLFSNNYSLVKNNHLHQYGLTKTLLYFAGFSSRKLQTFCNGRSSDFSLLNRLPELNSVATEWLSIQRELQQRVLLMIFTSFPFNLLQCVKNQMRGKYRDIKPRYQIQKKMLLINSVINSNLSFRFSKNYTLIFG